MDPNSQRRTQNIRAAVAHRSAFISPGEILKDWVRTIVALVAQTSEHARPTRSPSDIDITSPYHTRMRLVSGRTHPHLVSNPEHHSGLAPRSAPLHQSYDGPRLSPQMGSLIFNSVGLGRWDWIQRSICPVSKRNLRSLIKQPRYLWLTKSN